MRPQTTKQSDFTIRARFIASIWTLLIFLGCFLPAKDIPDVNVPLVDKWVHFLLFGGFTLFWMAGKLFNNSYAGLLTLIAGIALGILVELLQGSLTYLGRSADAMDAVADSIGALLGVLGYLLLQKVPAIRSYGQQ